LVAYELAKTRQHWSKSDLRPAPSTMWRYGPVLPAGWDEAISLGEGWTPLLPLRTLGAAIGARNLWLKDESQNPTASFEARGMSAVVTMAKKRGASRLAAASAGNAGGALAAYAAAAGLEDHVTMPADAPQANYLECKSAGAHVTLIYGLIDDCDRRIAERSQTEGWFDVGTLREPYRVEGKKTIGYELAEQFDWALPDAIVCPCGGGTGLIGIWKAFRELEELGWIGGKRPKLIAVQAAGCAPIVRALETGALQSEAWRGAHTIASGLRVPKPAGDFLVLKAIRESQGTALAVGDPEMLDFGMELARREGIFAAPEGGACVAAVGKLIASGFLRPDDRVMILNTASGLKHLEAYGTRFRRAVAGETDKLGGLITPR
jgi:threonine synthase